MYFENLVVRRLIMHEVHQRSDDRTARAPSISQQLEVLDDDALMTFNTRIVSALSGQAQAIRLVIAKDGEGSLAKLAKRLAGMADGEFIKESAEVATRLTDAHTSRKLPGGIVLVFSGTVGADSFPFCGVIKAETQSGFRRSIDGARSVMEFLKDVFLTPATRLYKIGIFVFRDTTQQLSKGCDAFVYDHNISFSNREAAALYFYESFMGCQLPDDGAYLTARFFDHTKNFVKALDISPDKKRDLIDSLFVFVRNEIRPTFKAEDFATEYFEPKYHDSYANFLRQKKFPEGAVVKDLSEMGNRLKRRRFNFGSDIVLSATPDAMNEKVSMKVIQGKGEGGVKENWTQLVIKEQLTGEM